MCARVCMWAHACACVMQAPLTNEKNISAEPVNSARWMEWPKAGTLGGGGDSVSHSCLAEVNSP